VSFTPAPPYDEHEGFGCPPVGCGKVVKAETAFFDFLKTLFILPVFTVPTFPSSQYYNIKQLNYK
jgi:hypothetical protein